MLGGLSGKKLLADAVGSGRDAFQPFAFGPESVQVHRLWSYLHTAIDRVVLLISFLLADKFAF